MARTATYKKKEAEEERRRWLFNSEVWLFKQLCADPNFFQIGDSRRNRYNAGLELKKDELD